MNTPTSETPETIIAASYARSYGENRGDKQLFYEIADTIEWLETRLRAAELKLQEAEKERDEQESRAVYFAKWSDHRSKLIDKLHQERDASDLRAKLIRAQTVEECAKYHDDQADAAKWAELPEVAKAHEFYAAALRELSPADPDVQRMPPEANKLAAAIRDAERYRWLLDAPDEWSISRWIDVEGMAGTSEILDGDNITAAIDAARSASSDGERKT